ncbi:MAG TPA: hypothetical protein VFZ34_15355 [Blastocatellia bacterium]|nr:hypothetical protein [Blastocatellia bacterium]
MATNEIDSLTLAPLSAGDLLDRIVRLYRRHWIALMRIAVLPVILSYLGLMALTLGFRNFSTTKGDLRIATAVLLILGGLVLYVGGKGVLIFLLGGTARALVEHFMDGSPVSVRSVYHAVRGNFWRLVGATVMVVALVLTLGIFLLYAAGMALGFYVIFTTWLLSNAPFWFQVTLHSIVGVLAFAALTILVLMNVKRVVFLPQVITVENKTVSAALSRSFALAGGEFRRKDFIPVVALVFFYVYISYSVLLLFMLPVYLYAGFNGIDAGPFNLQQPLWYTVLTNTISQASEILLLPVLMIGFILLYIDARVRREGYDLELLANRYLPAPGVEIPHGSFPMEVPKAKSHEPENYPSDDNDSFGSDSSLTVLSLR